MGNSRMHLSVVALLSIALTSANAECVPIKYRETCVPIEKLECKKTVSSFVNEVCYDAKSSYMVILLKTTWYHYCGIPQETVTALENGDVGRYYNSQLKGKFGCQGQPVPSY